MSKGNGEMTDHAKRVLTAFIGVPLLIAAILFAPFWALTIVIMGAALLALHEFYGILRPPVSKGIVVTTDLLTVCVFLSLLRRDLFFLALLPLFAMSTITVFLFSYRKNHSKSGDLGRALIGPFYICLPLLFFLLIAGLPKGKTWLLFILAVIFAGDTGSFYVGRWFGKHKLTSISPGKTWEGSVGGLLANGISAGIYGAFLFPALSLMSIVVLGIGLGISGQLGDLAESLLKRLSNIKDSGIILPGHGGLLDRIDSLLFAIPVLYLYLSF